MGGWTLDKLEVLRLYLKLYRKVAGGGTYIDGFAGAGELAVNGEIHPGSAALALDSTAFNTLHLFEQDPGVVARLRTTLGGHPGWQRCHVYQDDTNAALPALLASGRIPREKPCFAFLDPDSTQLAWATIQALAGYKELDEAAGTCKVELWILFNLHQAIQRLWPKQRGQVAALPPSADVLDRIMGGRDCWVDLWQQGAKSTSLLWRYRDLLFGLGYAYVFPLQIMDPASRRPQYWMIHATDHHAAVNFMSWAKKKSYTAAVAEPLPGVNPDAYLESPR